MRGMKMYGGVVFEGIATGDFGAGYGSLLR
jgi:hypothetical protein